MRGSCGGRDRDDGVRDCTDKRLTPTCAWKLEMDADLLRAFRGGNREALERVYRLCVSDVELRVRRALRSLGLLSAANLADLVQEVFLRAFSTSARLSYD